MTKALEKIREKHPLLGSRIVVDEDGECRFSLDGVPPIPLEVVADDTKDMWMRAASDEINYYFPWDRGPLIRFVLLHSGEHSDVLINCIHIVCDGRAMFPLVADLLRYATNPAVKVTPLPSMPPMEQLLPQGLQVKSGKGVLPAILNRAAALLARKANTNPALCYPKQHTNILAWTVDRQKTTSLLEKSKIAGISMHNLICAAFYMAQHQVQRSAASYLRRVKIRLM